MLLARARLVVVLVARSVGTHSRIAVQTQKKAPERNKCFGYSIILFNSRVEDAWLISPPDGGIYGGESGHGICHAVVFRWTPAYEAPSEVVVIGDNMLECFKLDISVLPLSSDTFNDLQEAAAPFHCSFRS